MSQYLSKKRTFLLLLSLVFCFAAVQLMAQDNQVTWSMALQNNKTGEAVSFNDSVKSRTGEQFQLTIMPDTDCYCYVVAQSSNKKDLAVLLAGRLRGKDTWHSAVLELSLPGGTESFFVVVSQDEQKNLANAITVFHNKAGSVQRRALLNEIYRLRTNASKFKEAPEKPVLMGGASRGNPNQGVEYSGSEIYVKTVSIEH